MLSSIRLRMTRLRLKFLAFSRRWWLDSGALWRGVLVFEGGWLGQSDWHWSLRCMAYGGLTRSFFLDGRWFSCVFSGSVP